MNERFFRFNTGRTYAPNYHGQRIHCLAQESGGFIKVYFWDCTRQIRGMVQWYTHRGLDTYADWSLEANLMTHYDRCDYSFPPELERKMAEIEQHYKER